MCRADPPAALLPLLSQLPSMLPHCQARTCRTAPALWLWPAARAACLQWRRTAVANKQAMCIHALMQHRCSSVASSSWLFQFGLCSSASVTAATAKPALTSSQAGARHRLGPRPPHPETCSRCRSPPASSRRPRHCSPPDSGRPAAQTHIYGCKIEFHPSSSALALPADGPSQDSRGPACPCSPAGHKCCLDWQMGTYLTALHCCGDCGRPVGASCSPEEALLPASERAADTICCLASPQAMQCTHMRPPWQRKAVASAAAQRAVPSSVQLAAASWQCRHPTYSSS
jgi:hypothetical protein